MKNETFFKSYNTDWEKYIIKCQKNNIMTLKTYKNQD